ncbi:MAG: zinc ABC transporter substrate-binding protein [Armatimonadota bacterium]
MYAATLSPLYDWLRALELPAVLLQPRGVDAHEVMLNVRMVQRALRARRIVAIGGGMEGYLSALTRALGRRCPPVMRLIEYLQPPPDDLHLWLDLGQARQSCAWLMRWAQADGLVNRSVRQAWRRVLLRFRQLEVQRDALRSHLQGKYYLALHDAYRPLTRSLGMHSLGSLLPDEEHPPSLPRLRRQLERAQRVPLAAVLSTTAEGIALTVARRLRVPLILADTLEQPDPKRDYFQRYAALLTALQSLAR